MSQRLDPAFFPLIPPIREASAPAPAGQGAPAFPAAADRVMLGRWRSWWVMRRIRWHLFRLVWRHTRGPLQALQAMRRLIRLRRRYLGDAPFTKVACVDGRYYYEYNTPGWPSPAYDDYHLMELNRVAPFRPAGFGFKNVIVAITKKCAMRCEHCFEWEALNGKEQLQVADLVNLVGRFQDLGVGQLQFSGGEPLLRLPAIQAILASARPGTDFWVITSGHLLSPENARALKQAGLTGITISLDHVDAGLHDEFRGFAGAYAWVEQAAAAARQAGLVTALSLCATQSFVTEENLMAYARLASRLGAVFIQLLEPKAVGHYAGLAVGLPPAQQKMLEDFYHKLNFDPAYHHLPLAVYYDYQRRREGCGGAADRHVYVDTDGMLHACPFCKKIAGSALNHDLPATLRELRQAGCPVLDLGPGLSQKTPASLVKN
ncbi:MAG: radical SAM protein [Adhaeribacter sp.]